jgi:hypothetical protein
MGDEGSLAELLEGQLEVPWILDPPAWLMDEWTVSAGNELPVLTVESSELDHSEAPGLQLLAEVAEGVRIELPENADIMFEPMDLINGVQLNCEESSHDLTDIELDRDQFERCRSPDELMGRIGPNSPEGTERESGNEQCEAIESLMNSARDLAQALTDYAGPLGTMENCKKVATVQPIMQTAASSEGRCYDCSANNPCVRDICTVAPETVVNETPQSPDYESDRDDWSDSSEQYYRPEVSPVSSAEGPFGVDPGAGTSSQSDYELGPSQAQKYWSQKVRRNKEGKQAKRVATIRPRVKWIRPVAIQDLQDPRRFRVTSQYPILRTRAIVSRLINIDGSILERALHDQFVMSRSAATQTPAGGVSMENQDGSSQTVTTQTCGHDIDAMSQAGERRDMATQTGAINVCDAQTDTNEDVWEIPSDEEANSGEGSVLCKDTSDESDCESMSSEHDSSSEESMESESSSAGTPVQDENEL